MSTKSINDLCSEIFEKSYEYSARSLSNESMCLDDDEALADEILHKMDAPVLSKLRRCFNKRRSSDTGLDPTLDIDRRVTDVMRKAAAEEGIEFPQCAPLPGHKTLWADEQLFVTSLQKIFDDRHCRERQIVGRAKSTKNISEYCLNVASRRLRIFLFDYRFFFMVLASAGLVSVCLDVRVRTRSKVFAERVHFCSHKYTTHAEKLFRLLDPFSTRRVWWGDLLDRLLQHGARRHRNLDDWKPLCEDARMDELPHCKKETIIKMLSIATSTSFCYIIISKGGKVGTYDGKLKLLTEYDIFFARSGQQRRMKTTWITDAIYMSDTKSLVIAASDRSLTMYDVSTLAHLPLYLITGIPNIPTCLTYEPSQSKAGASRLYFGDDHGCVTTVQFQQPRICLLHNEYSDRISDLFWIELFSPPQDTYVSVTVWKKVHIRSVGRIFYCARHDVVISCSNDPDASIVIRNRPGKIDDYVFKVLRGVSCFHMSSALRVLATGSADGCLRLWDPVLTLKPFAKMQNVHRKPIVDVAILAHMELVITFSKNAHADVWDIYEEVCVQSVRVRYPFIGVLGKRVEFGAFSLYPGPKRRSPATESADLMVPSLGSRRGSAVLLETGGLRLENPDDVQVQHYKAESRAETDPEYSYWDKLELLVTCCNHVAMLRFNPRPSDKIPAHSHTEVPSPLPPPERMTSARRPSVWENAELDEPGTSNRSPSPSMELLRTRSADQAKPDVHLLSPNAATSAVVATSTESADLDLDTILEQAGLTGILEKNFSLMMGLKQDLNKKLNELKSKQEAMKGPVCQCAPYIALDLHPLQDISFSHPLPISERMKKRSGLQLFEEPDHLLTYNTCFNMSSPRSSYSAGSSMPSTGRSASESTLTRTRK